MTKVKVTLMCNGRRETRVMTRNEELELKRDASVYILNVEPA